MARTGQFTRTCALCGLRIIEGWNGWTHLNTEAGKREERDHRPVPVT